MTVPAQARAAIAKALRSKDYEVQEPLFAKAFDAVGFPKDRDVPADPKDLTEDQRALCALIVAAEVHPAAFRDYAVPWKTPDRRRWLGLDPPGALERRVDFTWKGKRTNAPLWRAIRIHQEDRDERPRVGAVLDALPIDVRLASIVEMDHNHYSIDPDYLPTPEPKDVAAALRDRGARWATEQLDLAAAAFAALARMQPGWRPSDGFVIFAFEIALGAEVPLAPAWDAILPIVRAKLALAARLIRALPAERRDRVTAAALRHGHPNYAMNRSVELAAQFPSVPLFEVIFELCEKVERSVRKVLPALHKAAARSKNRVALKAFLDARMRGKPKPEALTITRRFSPKSPGELDKAQREQLAAALERYDGSSIGDDDELFADGLSTFSELARADGSLAYTRVDLYGDSGAVFLEDTVEAVASIIQGGLECEATLREALQLATTAKTTAKRSAKKPLPAKRKKR
jgi:hypothetical protein